MSVRATPLHGNGQHQVSDTAISPLDGDAHAFGEGTTVSTASATNPLKRTLHVEITGSFNELCLKSDNATWAPSSEALKAIFQQQKLCDIAHPFWPCTHANK